MRCKSSLTAAAAATHDEGPRAAPHDGACQYGVHFEYGACVYAAAAITARPSMHPPALCTCNFGQAMRILANAPLPSRPCSSHHGMQGYGLWAKLCAKATFELQPRNLELWNLRGDTGAAHLPQCEGLAVSFFSLFLSLFLPVRIGVAKQMLALCGH
eukprot:scaffold109584_cov19-Tisochrysis_lutea.AAC.1